MGYSDPVEDVGGNFIDKNNKFCSSRLGVSVIVTDFRSKGVEFKFYESTTDIRQEGYPEFTVLRCSSKKFGSKASV